MNKRLVPVLVLLIAAVIAGGFVWHRRHEAARPKELVLHGNVDVRQISLAFDGTGRIAELRAEEGDRVKAGQVLAVLDTQSLELQAREVEAQVEVQRQTVLRLRHGSRPDEIERALSQLKSAEADAQRAEEDSSSATRLAAAGAMTQVDADHAKTAAQVAKARVDDLRAAAHLTELGPRSEEVAGAMAQLTATEAQAALLRYQIDQGQLRAPLDSLVRSRLLEPGDMATPQKAVFALTLTKPKWIRVYVNEPDLGRIKPGMTARVVADGHAERPVYGKIGFISSVAEFTPKFVQTDEVRTSLVYEVRVVVEDNADALRLGQPVTVDFPDGSAP